MRRVLLAALAAAIMVAGLAGYQAGGASAADTPALADLEVVSVSGSPAAVSPPGGIVVYTITAKNDGPAPALARVHDDTTAGTYEAVDSHLPAEGCTTSGANTVDCDVTLLPGGDVSFTVAIRTPATAGPITNTATVSVSPSDPLGVVDSNNANDSKSATTAVTNDTTTSASLVQPGGTLRYKQSVLTNTGDTSVIVTLDTAPGGTCGTGTCGAGLGVDFDPNPAYQGHVSIDVSFGSGDPCRGNGAPKCFGLWVRKNGTTSPIQSCPGIDPTLPCLSSVFKVGNAFHWIVQMDSDDPDLLPLK